MTNKNFNNKKINNNGFNFVDLGLPSGTLWASCNVGASKPSDSGLYFQWGDTKGYTKNQVGVEDGKKAFTWTDNKYGIKGASTFFTKYEKKGEALEIEDDAANANLGGDWHMPTPEQIEELIDNTTSAWTTQGDINGRLFTSKTDTSKSIFIPASGIAWEGWLYNVGSGGSIWSSVLSEGSVGYGQVLRFYSGNASLYSIRSRYLGCSVRGVIG